MKKIINKISLIALAFFALNSCVDNDPQEFFKESTSVRIDQQVKEVKDLLLASEQGWKVTYFTDDSELGGYTYLMDFTDGKTVVMDSDFGATKGTRTLSEWDVTLGSTVKLSFTTRNKIHELSDSDNSPDADLVGQGYKGSFEFLYYGKNGEDLVFRANRGFNEVIFKKATAEDWDDLNKNDAIMSAISGQLAYEISTDISFFSYNTARRFASNLDTEVNETDFGIGFTPTGIIISPAIELPDGTKYSEFTLNDAKNKFVSEDGNFSIFILVPPFDIDQGFTINILGAGDVSDTFFNTYLEIRTASIRARGWDIGRVLEFGTTSINGNSVPGIEILNIRSTTSAFIGKYNLSFAGVFGNSDLLNVSRSGPGFNWRFFTYLDPMVELIVTNSPYKVEALPSLNEPNVVKLTSNSNPDVFFTIRR